MHCAIITTVAAVMLSSLAPQPAWADGGESWARLGGFFGVRTFSSSSSLGSPTQSSLSNAVVFGVRASHRFLPWLSGEAELPVLVTGSRDDGATVFFSDPRVHALFEFDTGRSIRPFGVVGVGMPLALSSERSRFNSDILPEWNIGLGAKFDRKGGWSVRVDLRVVLMPARGDNLLTPELEVFVSLYRFGGASKGRGKLVDIKDLDTDGDKVLDVDDKCPNRAEDMDGYEDEDGCPDIDDDGDEVLDIADKCRLEPETWNGYRDDDGCPDVLPVEVSELEGVLKGVTFERSSGVMRRSSYKVLNKIAAILVKYPTLRGRIVGHTDATGDPEKNLDLSQQRADSVKFYLVARGVAEYRLGAVGLGGDAPIADDSTARGRAKNRRVEFQVRRRD